jgi:NADH dehydrogenase
MTRPRVLIIGGGFGGVFAARRLRGVDAEVTLLDRGTSHVFQPLLYQCATGILSEGHITQPLRTMFRKRDNIQVVLGEANRIDAAEQVVTALRPDGTEFRLPYDHLIVGVGMRQSYFGHDEFAEFAPGMKTLDDALNIRRRVFGAFEMAETVHDPVERAKWLTFAVVGAGPTGVELAGQIRELATRTIADEFRSIDPTETRVLLFDGVDKVLGAFGDKLSSHAERILGHMGVETKLGRFVSDVDSTGLELSGKDGSKERYETRTVFWTAGVEAVPFVHELAKATGAEQDRAGRIQVRDDLTIPGHDNIWVLGDIMSLKKLPGVAEVALQGGLYAGGRVRALVTGKPLPDKPFQYHDLGNAAYISRWHALVDAGPLKLHGFFGWLIWGFIHIAFLSGMRNRIGTLATWMLAIARGRRRERAIPYGNIRTAEQPYQRRRAG